MEIVSSLGARHLTESEPEASLGGNTDRGCLDGDLLGVFATRRAALAHSAVCRIEAHLSACATCRDAADLLTPDSEQAEPEYEFVKLLGQGGQARVELHRWRGRQVAVKIYDARKAVLERVQAECTVLTSIDHPNLVRCLESGVWPDGSRYLTLEYHPGGDLDGRLGSYLPVEDGPRRRKLSVEQTLEIFLGVVAALSALHDRGVVHRDLKHGNVLLKSETGWQVAVADLGLAKDRESPMTATGDHVGTEPYRSPENRAQGSRVVGPAEDVWAVGVMMYECLTGRHPFLSAGRFCPIKARDTKPARLPGVSPALEAVVFRCLSKDPEARYADAGELHEELTRCFEGRPVSARPPGVLNDLRDWLWCDSLLPLFSRWRWPLVGVAMFGLIWKGLEQYHEFPPGLWYLRVVKFPVYAGVIVGGAWLVIKFILLGAEVNREDRLYFHVLLVVSSAILFGWLPLVAFQYFHARGLLHLPAPLAEGTLYLPVQAVVNAYCAVVLGMLLASGKMMLGMSAGWLICAAATVTWPDYGPLIFGVGWCGLFTWASLLVRLPRNRRLPRSLRRRRVPITSRTAPFPPSLP